MEARGTWGARYDVRLMPKTTMPRVVQAVGVVLGCRGWCRRWRPFGAQEYIVEVGGGCGARFGLGKMMAMLLWTVGSFGAEDQDESLLAAQC